MFDMFLFFYFSKRFNNRYYFLIQSSVPEECFTSSLIICLLFFFFLQVVTRKWNFVCNWTWYRCPVSNLHVFAIIGRQFSNLEDGVNEYFWMLVIIAKTSVWKLAIHYFYCIIHSKISKSMFFDVTSLFSFSRIGFVLWCHLNYWRYVNV